MPNDRFFNFQLFPIEQITPWGEPPDLYLSWYALTLGHYWFDLGSTELFRFTPAILEHWTNLADFKPRPGNFLPYDHYQLAHIESELNKLFHHVLEPIPLEVARHIPQINTARNLRRIPSVPSDVLTRLGHQYAAPTDHLLATATDWWRARQVDTLYLRYKPVIHFYRTENTIHILWQTSHLTQNDIPIWTAVDGHHQLPCDQLLQEFRDFRARLAAAMRQRVDALAGNWKNSDITLDLPRLKKNQADFESSLVQTFSVIGQTDWSSILEAIDRFPGILTNGESNAS